MHPSSELSAAAHATARRRSVISRAESYELDTVKVETKLKSLRSRSHARSSLVPTVAEESSLPTQRRRLSGTDSATLDMDHIYLSFRDFLWGMTLLAPNAGLLQLGGMAWLIWRQSMQRLGLIRAKPHDPRRTAANLVLESFRAMHYASQRVVDGNRIATFLWHEMPTLDANAKFKVHDWFRVEIDLDEKLLRCATLDDCELTPQETVVVLYFNTISADHVKIHSLGNWACNVEQSSDKFLRWMSVVSIMYNYFGATIFRFLTMGWHRIGLLNHDYRDIPKVFEHGVKQGIPAHAGVVVLAPDSKLIDFTVKLRNVFLNKFAKVHDQFPGIDGEALFASTIIHSLDHQHAVWNMPDPLWLEIDTVRDNYKAMAEICRFVRVGFVPSLPLLLFASRYRDAPHPFYREIYKKAVKLDRTFADEMDACIVR